MSAGRELGKKSVGAKWRQEIIVIWLNAAEREKKTTKMKICQVIYLPMIALWENFPFLVFKN